MTGRPWKVGDRVAVRKDIDLQPYTTVRGGELGTVARIDMDGNIDIRMDEEHPGLRSFSNCIWVLSTGDTSDVVDALVLFDPDTQSSNSECQKCKTPLLSARSQQRSLSASIEPLSSPSLAMSH
jgi:hypothetical protein